MRDWLRWALIACLTVVYVLALLAVLHPRTSQKYRAYYIDRTSVEWNPPHYRASPEEGMVFAQPGLPDWVAWTYGFTAREPRGRWTDDDLGNIAGLVLDRPFSGTFCLELRTAAAPHMSSSFGLRFGSQSETIQLRTSEFADYQVQVNNVKDAEQLEFVLPKQLPRIHDYDPQNGDPRRLGLLLSTLKILTGSCNPVH
jgi:hypothetical protein